MIDTRMGYPPRHPKRGVEPLLKREFPKAYPHGELREVMKDVFFVTGTVPMPGPLPITFSRNMTVIRHDGALTLVNSLRLDEAGLAALERLGKVAHVVRLAGFHGMDDPFYKDRYGAKVWALRGQVYSTGFDPPVDPTRAYFMADVEVDASTELPLPGARLYLFSTKPPEGLLLLDRDGGVVVAGDCLQNWAAPDRYFSFLGKLMMRAMGFLKPHNVGPGWLRAARPKANELRGVLDLPFEHVLPAHGAEVMGGAKEAFRPSLTRVSS